MTDPWAHQARKDKEAQSTDPKLSASQLTPLSLALPDWKSVDDKATSRPPSTIPVPQDPKKQSDWLRQQVEQARINANRHPSFFSTVANDDREGSPTPGQKKGKEKHKSKKSIHPPDEEAKRLEKKERFKAEMEQQTARAIEGMQAGTHLLPSLLRQSKRT
jgi:hypothetical protein